ncbi:MAG: hypothetical protein ACK4HL_03915 [Aestuariivirga sp.]
MAFLASKPRAGKEAMIRSSRDMITFHHSFSLAGLDALQPPGTYMVITEEEEIPGLSFQAWRRIATQIYLPAIGVDSGKEQVVTIDPRELAQAQKRDTEKEEPEC